MEVLIHFIFQLVKIGFLSLCYSFLLFQLLKILKKRVENLKVYKWFYYYFIIYFLLFIYSFTYWGNHGLGDGAKIPIGNWKVIENVNWDYGSYLNFENTQFDIDKFIVENGNLYAKTSDFFTSNNYTYFIINLDTNEVTKFKDKQAYNSYAKERNFPQSKELLSFSDNYLNYWGGARFFLLP